MTLHVDLRIVTDQFDLKYRLDDVTDLTVTELADTARQRAERLRLLERYQTADVWVELCWCESEQTTPDDCCEVCDGLGGLAITGSTREPIPCPACGGVEP